MLLLFASTNPPVPPGGFSVGSAAVPGPPDGGFQGDVCYHRESPGGIREEGKGATRVCGEGVLPRDKAGVKMALKMKKDVCEGCRQGFGKEGVKVVNGFRYCKKCADYTMKYQGMLFY